MKHWNALTNVETQIIRLGEFKNLFELVLSGVESGSASVEQIQSGLYTMSGMLEEIDTNLSNEFQSLWDEVRDEDEDESTISFDFGAAQPTMNSFTAGADTITITGLDPIYGDHGGGSTLADYPDIKLSVDPWAHTVNQISKFNK
jgi:hypothetical protein